MERKRSFPAVVRQQTREEDLDSATEGLGPLAQFERHACTVSGLPHSEGASSSASVFTRERAGARTVQASVSSAVPHKDAAREDPGSDWSGRQVQATIVESAESHEGERPMQDCPRRRGHREESADEDAGAIRVDVAPFREDAENDSMRSTVTPRGISQRGRCDRRATGGDSEDFAPQRFRPSSRCARQRPFVSKDSSEFERRPLTKQGRHTSSSRSMESEAAVILGRAPNSLSISQRVEDASEGWDESSDALRPQRQTGGQSSREGSRASQATKDEAKQVRHSSGSRSSREGSRVSFAKEESKASSQTSGTRQPSRPMQPHGASCGDLAYEGSEVWSDTIGIWKPLLESEQASPAGKSEEQRFSREISLSSKRSSSSRAGEASQCTPAAPAAPAIREDSLPSSNGSASSAEEKEALLSSSGSEMSLEGEEHDLNLFDAAKQGNLKENDLNLFKAAEQGNLKDVRRLLDSGANVNAKDERADFPYYNGTPLCLASRVGHVRVAERLLQARAHVEQADKLGATPLVKASCGHSEVLERLLQARADVDQQDFFGDTPLSRASGEGHVEVVKFLVQQRADVNQAAGKDEAAGKDGKMPLHLALEKNYREVTICLARYARCDMRVLKDCLMGGGATRVAVLDELTAQPFECSERDDVLSRLMRKEQFKCVPGPFESHIASTTLLFCPYDVPRKHDLLYPECGVNGSRARWFTKERLCDLFKLSLSADLLNDRDSIRILCKSDDEVLLTDFAEVLLQAAWKRHELLFYFDVCLSAVFVALLCAATGHTRHGEEVPLWMSISLLSLLGKRIFEEIAQFVDMLVREKTRKQERQEDSTFSNSWCIALLKYVFDLDNIVDLTFLITSACAVTFCFVLRRHYNGPFSKFAIAFVVAQAWIRLLYSLRGFRPVGTRMLPILRAIWHTKIFLVVVLLCLAAGVHAYYTLGLRGDPNPIYASIMQIGNLGVLGDFDLFTFEGEDVIYEEGDNGTWVPKDPTPTDDYLYAHVVFFSVAVLITIFLMNLLIGVLSANYDLYEEVANALFLRSRARFIISFSLRPWSGCIRALKRVLNCVSCGYLDKCTRGLKRSLNCISCGCVEKCITRFRGYFCSQDWSKLWEGRETIDLWFLKPVTPGTEDLRSMRAVLADKLKGQAERIETVQKRLNDCIETVEKRLNAKLEDQHAQLKKIEELILKMAEPGRGGRSSGRNEGSFSRPPRTSRQHSWPSA
eukprot:TRINITY_DN5404_c0_g1_i15.p1 TRINITY_DN5404_c0_g1~~TRINITY_DN5404_c0_g1_i15.p1  ORF type:complete len:1219 (-),score=195.70 TRINITY_DN5404_c0_g1_i15:22-3678(-)